MKIFALVLLLLLSVPTVFACSCFNTTNITDAQHSKYLRQVKAIFYGEVISLGEKRKVEKKYRGGMIISSIYQPIRFKVLQSWKGIETADVSVETEAESSCRFIPSVGSKFMVYAYEDKDMKIPLYINYCSIGHFDDEKMKREFGAGRIFEQTQIDIIQAEQNSESFLAKLWKTVTSFFS